MNYFPFIDSVALHSCICSSVLFYMFWASHGESCQLWGNFWDTKGQGIFSEKALTSSPGKWVRCTEAACQRFWGERGLPVDYWLQRHPWPCCLSALSHHLSLKPHLPSPLAVHVSSSRRSVALGHCRSLLPAFRWVLSKIFDAPFFSCILIPSHMTLSGYFDIFSCFLSPCSIILLGSWPPIFLRQLRPCCDLIYLPSSSSIHLLFTFQRARKLWHINFKNGLSLFFPLTMWLCGFSNHKVDSPPLLLNLEWPSDLLWTETWAEVMVHLFRAQALRGLYGHLLFLRAPSQHENKSRLACWKMGDNREESWGPSRVISGQPSPQPTQQLTTDAWKNLDDLGQAWSKTQNCSIYIYTCVKN